MPINRAFQRLKKPMKDGFFVRWMREDEGNDKNIFTITVKKINESDFKGTTIQKLEKKNTFFSKAT